MTKRINLVKVVLFFFSVFLYVSCNKNRELNKLDWMLGRWEGKSHEGVIYEIWDRVNDTLYQGQGIVVIKEDTVFKENLTIQVDNGEVVYLASPNGRKKVPFKLVLAENQKAIFENTGHDFPSRITYNLISKDSLTAVIEGTIDGKSITNKFKWAKK